MQNAFPCLGLAIVIMAVGCEQHTKTDTSRKMDLDPSTIAKADGGIRCAGCLVVWWSKTPVFGLSRV